VKHIEQDALKLLLTYNPETGIFTWNKREVSKVTPNKRGVNVFNSLYAGDEAGNINYTPRSKTPYLHIQILGKTYKAHRLAFIYMEGQAPEEVDHKDHNGLNNKWSNLRASNNRDNSKNLPKQKSNKTGVIGVNWHKSAKKWQARAVNHDGVRVDLGRHDNFEDAVKARREHEIKFGYYENRGGL
jgi:hypothetical protein